MFLPPRGALAGGDGQLAPPVESGDAASPAPARTFLLTLESGAFPKSLSHPSALVHLPTGFDPLRPVSLIVYIHGFHNCVENAVRRSDEARPCRRGGPVRNGYGVIEQVEQAAGEGKNLMLLAPEVAFDQASADPGKLGEPGGFRALVSEVLDRLREPLNALRVDGFAKVAVASHSGGYQAAAGIAVRGGVPVSEVYLLDSLYGSVADFESFVKKDLASFDGSSPQRRLAIVYTDTGGTLVNSQSFAGRLAELLSQARLDPGILFDDRTTATWPAAAYDHGLLVKRSALTHDGVARYYLYSLLSTSGL
jgi:hypothetical protein